MTKFCLATLASLATGPAFASAVPVPEIDGLAGLTAMAAVAGVVTLVWERRRRK
jgi:hypothetical protein